MKYEFYKTITRELEKPHTKYGFVYCLESEDGKIKIGRSSNVFKRINTLKSQNSSKIINIVISEPALNYYEIERSLHKTFKEKRLNGEWFDLKLEDCLEELKKIKTENKDVDVLIAEEKETLKAICEFANSLCRIRKEEEEESFFPLYTDINSFKRHIIASEELEEFEQIEELKKTYPNLYNNTFDEKEMLEFSMEMYCLVSHYGLDFILEMNKDENFELITWEEAKERIEIMEVTTK